MANHSKTTPENGLGSNLDIEPAMTWYDLGVHDELIDTPVPFVELDITVDGHSISTLRNSKANDIVQLIVCYRGTALPVGQDGFYPFYVENKAIGKVFAVSLEPYIHNNEVKDHVFLGVAK